MSRWVADPRIDAAHEVPDIAFARMDVRFATRILAHPFRNLAQPLPFPVLRSRLKPEFREPILEFTDWDNEDAIFGHGFKEVSEDPLLGERQGCDYFTLKLSLLIVRFFVRRSDHGDRLAVLSTRRG